MVALKQLVSPLFNTLAATLVPPEPKPALSLTWERKRVNTRVDDRESIQVMHARRWEMRGRTEMTYDCDKLRVGGEIELETERGCIAGELL